ncbi:hypothetical protein FRB91_001758 [Serendipita sp. 411]|nr:hypothetical protein FRB91_001758 [Serendipita sp. 411]
MNPSQQMKLFRKPQKPITPRSPGTMDVGNGPGNGNSGGIAGVLSRAGGDLSSRIEPYTFPSSSPPPALQQHHHQSSRSGSNPLQQTSSHDTLGTVTGPGVVAAAVSGPRADPLMSSTRRNSLRARPSEDERWVMVDDSTMESRSSSIASLIPAGAAAPYNSPGFTQTTTVVPSGSIHSQHKDGWARNLFGGTGGGKEREKEANVELVRMIGFLTAAAPDDWNMVLEVCDRASASESAAKEAARALRREFKYGEPSAQLSAARLWAIMLQNASETFILQTSSRKFLENLEDVINAETTSPVVRERLLDVLASAAYKFGKMPGKEGFAAIWRKVRPSWKPAEGLPFDSLEGLFDSAFPRRLVPGQPPGQSVEPRERREDRDRAKKERDRDKHLLQQQRQLDGHGYRTHGIIPPSVPTPTAYNQHPGQTPLTPLHLPPQSASLQAPSPIQLQQVHDLTAQPVHPRAPQQPQPQPQTQTQPHHAHHASNHSVSGGYGNATLNLPPGAPHGPRSLPITRSRTPSPDRSGTYSTGSTPPVASTPINGSDYGPPSHPPPPQLSHATNNNNSNNMRSAGKRYDSASRGRTESPVPISIGITPPPGLSGVATSAGVAMHNTAGMRIDMDAARRYESSDEEGLLTPIKPSEKALGKRRAVADAPVDEEELGRREQAELEEAYIRSTVPPGAEPDSPTRPVQYVYDAAAERALELDAMEKEQERLRRQRASMQRGNGGGSAAAAAVVS